MISNLFGSVLGMLSGGLGLLWGCSWVFLFALGCSWVAVAWFWGALGLLLGRLELLLATLGLLWVSSWMLLGCFQGDLGSSWGGLVPCWDAFWGTL